MQGWQGDAGFWELFEHARRLHLAVQRLTSEIEPGSATDLLAHRQVPDAEDAWRRTQEMQVMFMSLLQAVAETHEEGS
jgi:hypothetical protein